MKNKCHLNATDLSRYLKDLFGLNAEVSNIRNMNGGAQKVVYQIECMSGLSCILYVWDDKMNYFREEKEKESMLDQSSGADLLELNHQFFNENGIRTPKIYAIHKEKREYPFDFAFVESINGGDLEQLNVKDQNRVLGKLGNMLRVMHGTRRTTYGKWNQKPNKQMNRSEKVIFENTFEQLEFASKSIQQIAENKESLVDKINELYEKIEPRKDYGFIHGELGPDHVLIDQNLDPFLIDIEGEVF